MRSKYLWLFCVILAFGSSLSKSGETEKLENSNRQTLVIPNLSIPKHEAGETSTVVRRATLDTSMPKSETVTGETITVVGRATLASLLSRDAREITATLLSKIEIKETDKINGQTRTIFDPSLAQTETETERTNHGLGRTILNTTLPKTETETAKINHGLTHTTVDTFSQINTVAANGSHDVAETMFTMLSDTKTAKDSKGVTDSTFGTSSTIPDSETVKDIKDVTESTFGLTSTIPETVKAKDGHDVTETTFGTSSTIPGIETTKNSHDVTETTFGTSSMIHETMEAKDSHDVTETTFSTSSMIHETMEAKDSHDETETTFSTSSMIPETMEAKDSHDETETTFSTSLMIHGTETTLSSHDATETTTLSSPFWKLETDKMKGSHGLPERTRHVNYASAKLHRLAVTTAGDFADSKMLDQGGFDKTSSGVSTGADTETDDPRADTDWSSHLKDSNNSGLKIFQTKQVLDSARKTNRRPGQKCIRIKTLEGNKPTKGDDCGHVDEDDDENGDEDEIYYDQIDDSDSVYTLAHFRHELYTHMEDRLRAVNESVLGFVTNIYNKVSQLENQQISDIQLRCRLQSILQAMVKPNRGDIRILAKDGCLEAVRTGYLQFYTGREWGFICDDSFNEAAVKVACRQLGLARSDATNQRVGLRRMNVRHEPSFDRSWDNQFSIVLDDVQCSGKEYSVDSCYHSDVGRHDCSMDEIVYLAC